MSGEPTTHHSRPRRPVRPEDRRSAEQIQEALRGMEHGRLTVVVQDGVIVQLERTDKQRLPTDPTEQAG